MTRHAITVDSLNRRYHMIRMLMNKMVETWRRNPTRERWQKIEEKEMLLTVNRYNWEQARNRYSKV